MKMSFFAERKLKVLDVALGAYHTVVLCKNLEENQNRVFCFGSSEKGQVGYGGSLEQHTPVELTDKIPGEVIQIAAGGLHTLILTKDNKVYGCGKVSNGQLGFVPQKKVKAQLTPMEVKMPANVKVHSVHCGSLTSMALCSEE